MTEKVTDKLVITLLDANGEDANLIIPNPDRELTETEIKTAVNNIIDLGVIMPAGSAVVSCSKIELIETTTSSIDVGEDLE